MEMAKKIELLEDVMEVDAGSLTPEMELADIETWDSMAQLSFIAMLDDDFGRAVSADELIKFKTVAELLAIME